MPIGPTDFQFALSPTPLQAVIGYTTTAVLTSSNISLTDTAYNLGFTATLPDGVSFVSSDLPPTNITNNPSGTISLSWVNIKDLAPNELNYRFNVILKSDEVFRATGLPVPFDTPIPGVIFSGTVDTLPRGNDDPGNIQYTVTQNTNFIPLRYNLIKSGPGKMPKGAGFLSPAIEPRWPFTYTLTVQNNILQPSTVTLIDNLPNGIRYLDALSVSGPDAVALSSPTVILPPAQDFVTLNWGTITLSPFSTNVITFTVAIWDNFTVGGVENSGARITHMTPLQNTATLNGASGPVTSNKTTNAMDATIDKSVTSTHTDVGVTNNYTLVYKVNQYDPVNGFVVTDTLSDGQSFVSASPYPDSISVVAGVTTLVWNLGNLATGTQGSITFTSATDPSYVAPPGPVSAGDSLTNLVSVNGTNANFGTPTPDSSAVTISITIPTLTKEVLGYFYKDGTPKTITTAAPGDFIEFRLTYNASGITAEQRSITLDDFFPTNMNPLSITAITYGGTAPVPPPPVTISPNGLRWTLGTLPANSTFIATFRVQVKNDPFVGALNNLGKLAGTNTAGLAYSARDQVLINFGSPNITLSKSVTGPNINAIKAGETYTYSILIANPQNLTSTTVDAFDIDLTDVIPTGLTYLGGSTSVTGTGTFNPPTVVGQNVSLHILQLAPNQTLTLNFSVIVDTTIGAGQAFTNNANNTNPYSQPFTGIGDFQYSDQNRHADTTLRSVGITLTKTPTPVFAKIGDTVTYIITATVPLGTNAYNLQVVDNYPFATQLYQNNATKDGFPILPTVVPGTVTFPVVPIVNATLAAVNVTYTFDIRVTGGTHVPPFIENQNDTATVSWEISPGVPATPVTVTVPLQVRTPSLTGRKEQRNVTTGGIFTTNTVQYSPGDVVEYRINLTNNGAETAFDTVLTDVLNPLLSFNAGSFSATLGTASFLAGTVTWNIPQIPAGITATLIFTVTTLPGVPSNGLVPNRGTFIYNTNNNGFGINYGPTNTNTTNLRSPRVTLTKTASPTVGEIGDDLTYTLTVVVPNGTIAYKLTVDDTLPANQTYIGPATRQILPNPAVVVPTSILGPSISFLDGNPDINASAGAVTIIYTFIARITNATHNPPYQEIQTNSGRVRWSLVSGGSLTQQSTATVNITARTPHITVLKEQSNNFGVSYTTGNLTVLPGNTIYYRFTINSNGASPAYNLILNDVLDPFLTYNGVISLSHGSVTPPPPAVVWNIPVLNNGSTAVLVFSVTVAPGIGAGGSIHDQGTSTYDSNDVNPITYPANSNTVTLDIPHLTLTKTSPTLVAAIGDTLTYTLNVGIPNGVAAHNLVIQDIIPTGQTYVGGSWTPLPAPGVVLNQLTYTHPTTPVIGPTTLSFQFQTTVTSGDLNPPYSQVQTNVAEVFWDITPIGPQAPPVSATFDIDIRTPHLTSLKKQRNVTQGGSFSTDPLIGVLTGDIIEYQITLTNDGANTAYNVTSTDVLDVSLTFQGVVAPPPPGTVANSVPLGNPDGTLTWSSFNLSNILPSNSATLTFSVLVNAGFPPGSRITDQSSTLYDTNLTNPTTLGPVLSNQVAFNFTLPLITKTVDQTAVFLGDTVTYSVTLTIPRGNIAYNVQVTDTLPPTQNYVVGSLTRNGSPVIPQPPSLQFPPEGTLDATSAALTITYTFQATVTSLVVTPQDAQTNSATIAWTHDPAGLNPGPPQTATVTIYATNSDISILKEQLNFSQGGSYTTNVIQSAPGDEIYYRLSVTNPGANAIFNVTVTDILDPFLLFGVPISIPIGILGHNGVNPGGTVTWSISSIGPGITYQAEFSTVVQTGIGSQALIPDTAEVTFTATSAPPVNTYGPRQSNTVNQQMQSLQFSKTAPATPFEVGSIFPYTLTVLIPAGLKAYNVVIEDVLPVGQTFAGGGSPVPPVVVGQVVTFPTLPLVDATGGQVTLVYSFLTQITSGNTSSPYTEVQTNSATVTYDSDPFGTPATPLTSNLDITATNPFVFITKVQRNVTKDTGFITTELDVEVGDVVRYKINAFSQGASPAYNVIVTDILGPFKQFLGIVTATAGTATGGATVTWTIPSIAPGTSESLIFEVQVLAGISAGGADSNMASAVYDTNPVTPITFGPTDSNRVVLRYPNVRITKTANLTNAAVGNNILYTVTFTLPRGTIAYNGQFTDTLHPGQQYNNHATLNGVPIVPSSVIGQVITFPVVPFSSAGSTDLEFIYTFEALVVSAGLVDPVTLTEVQINEAVGNWYLDPETPAPPVDALAEVTVTNSSVQLRKEQRNSTRNENFTVNPIKALAGELIEYRMTVINGGPNTVYNLTVQDLLSTNLKFLGTLSVPVGTVTYSGGSFNGTVTFSLPVLTSGSSATAIFSVQVIAEILTNIPDFLTGIFNITLTDPTRYQAIPSNTTLVEIEQSLLKNLDVSECILVKKIFSQCQKRECFTQIPVATPPGYALTQVSFHRGSIIAGSLVITPLVERPNYARVTFEVSVPYTATFVDPVTLAVLTTDGLLPPFTLDTLLYIPQTRSESTFDILLDTEGILLDMDHINSTFSVGLILIISVASQVQLLIPTFGYCEDFCSCEEYLPPNPCADFLDPTKTVFPEDFFG